MKNEKAEQRYEIGMVGLGVMGRNLLLNMAEHGFSVAGYDKDAGKAEKLRQEAKGRDVCDAADVQGFVALLRRPRALMMLVPAGAPVAKRCQAIARKAASHLIPKRKHSLR